MATLAISKTFFIKEFKRREITLFTLLDIKKIFQIRNKNTLYHLLRRLKHEEIIEQLARGKYLFSHALREVNDYEIANFLVIPSYISLESALSFYGIIEQFPYGITSVTPKKTREFTVRNKTFRYGQIAKKYYKDYIRLENFLIASKEKALFDYLYYSFKQQRSPSSLQSLSAHLQNQEYKQYLTANANKKMLSFLKNYVEL